MELKRSRDSKLYIYWAIFISIFIELKMISNYTLAYYNFRILDIISMLVTKYLLNVHEKEFKHFITKN
jgi:hypothetical protein